MELWFALEGTVRIAVRRQSSVYAVAGPDPVMFPIFGTGRRGSRGGTDRTEIRCRGGISRGVMGGTADTVLGYGHRNGRVLRTGRSSCPGTGEGVGCSGRGRDGEGSVYSLGSGPSVRGGTGRGTGRGPIESRRRTGIDGGRGSVEREGRGGGRDSCYRDGRTTSGRSSSTGTGEGIGRSGSEGTGRSKAAGGRLGSGPSSGCRTRRGIGDRGPGKGRGAAACHRRGGNREGERGNGGGRRGDIE